MRSVTSIVTLKERKAGALAARDAASAQIKTRLAAEAARHGGWHRIFGSAARDELRPDKRLSICSRTFPKTRTGAVPPSFSVSCQAPW